MADKPSSAEVTVVDNSHVVLNKIGHLYAERLMSDVCLVVGGVEYPSHRLILCAYSDVFQIMLMNGNWSEATEKRIVLQETPSAEAVFEDFLKYLYTGKICLDFATVIPIVGLADKYNVIDLLRVSLGWMSRNVSTACKRNQVVSWFQFAQASGHSEIADLCKDFIKANFSLIAANIDFPNMEVDTLAMFISCNDLVIRDELTLFRCVDAWLCAQREALARAGEENIDLRMDRYLEMLIPHIRFPMMTTSDLAHLLLNPMTKTHTDLIFNKIRIALSYQSEDCDIQRLGIGDNGEKLDCRLFTPRLYTAERFCSSLTIENLHTLPFYVCRGLVFSSHGSMRTARSESETSPWMVDVFPRGVFFQKCQTVYGGHVASGLEVPDRVLRTVRVSVQKQKKQEARDIRVRIGVLVSGCQDGFEHVRKVVTRNFTFHGGEQVLNLDDVVDFDEINDAKRRSHYLCEPSRSCLKLNIVITPLSKISSRDLS